MSAASETPGFVATTPSTSDITASQPPRTVSTVEQPENAAGAASSPTPGNLTRTRTGSVSTASRIRGASIKILEADAPLGMWAATGSTFARAPSLSDIRRGAFHHEEGWNQERVQEHRENRLRRSSTAGSATSPTKSGFSRTNSGMSVSAVGRRKREGTGGTAATGEESVPAVVHEEEHADHPASVGPEVALLDEHHGHNAAVERDTPSSSVPTKDADAESDYEYTPPPKLPWTTSFKIGALGFWKWFCTPLGFLITIYALNIVAWGGMIFLLLIGGAPAMCHPTCDDINSPRRKWIEYDAQILTALFCVTAWGLIPWRFRDFYWLMMYRLGRKTHTKEKGIRMLAGIHRGWFRLPGSDNWRAEGDSARDQLNPGIPLPLSKRLDVPLTHHRAPPTATWKLDFVIWNNMMNTVFQTVLCGFMWGMNRYDRPSWSTGVFVALACVVAGLGGIMMAVEGKKVKKVEGVPSKVATQVKDIETGVVGSRGANNEPVQREKR